MTSRPGGPLARLGWYLVSQFAGIVGCAGPLLWERQSFLLFSFVSRSHAVSQVSRISWVAPRADSYTDATTQRLVEIRYATVKIHIPFFSPSHGTFFMSNRARRAGVGAYPAVDTEVIGTETVRGIGEEWEVRCHAGETKGRAVLSVNNRAVFAELTEAGSQSSWY